MRLVPVYFGAANSATLKANHGLALEFSPARGTELPVKSHDLADPAPDRDDFNILDLPEQFELHQFMPSAPPATTAGVRPVIYAVSTVIVELTDLCGDILTRMNSHRFDIGQIGKCSTRASSLYQTCPAFLAFLSARTLAKSVPPSRELTLLLCREVCRHLFKELRLQPGDEPQPFRSVDFLR